ncbi:M10 family metallopeptidase C-terminal domain-containing protein, partial [bacterium]|nr:M10 family metallopeptidase C-terminal domain-containing protein [bacterium]
STILIPMADCAYEVGYKTSVRVPLSGNQWIDGLTDGYRWGVTDSDSEIGYTFIGDTTEMQNGEFGGYPSWGWTAMERQAMENAMNEISSVSGLEFVNRGDNNDDEVEIWYYLLDDEQSDDSFGFAYTPGSDSDEGLVAVNWTLYRTDDETFTNSISPGSFYGITFLHELCHAVGLKHPHEVGLIGQPRFPGLFRSSNEFKDKGQFEQNAHPFTQLTYVDKGARNGYVPRVMEDDGFLKSLGALDTAAMQWLYGLNSTHASNNDVYYLPRSNRGRRGWRCIWDTGGIDRIDGSKSNKSVLIDLRNATLDSSIAAGGYPSSVDGVYGGFTIAHDWNGRDLSRPANLCVIENAVGGRSDDRLIGNGVANVLRGKRGDDVLYSGGGWGDRLIGGSGKDQFWIKSELNSFVKIMDFSPKDRLVFDVDKSDLSVFTSRGHSFVEIDSTRLVKIVNFPDFSLDNDCLFNAFEGL